MSDSHGRSGKVKKIMAAHQDADCIIYLGDGEKDFAAALADDLQQGAGAKNNLTVLQVRGNCDRESSEAVTLIREIGGIHFYITHGYEQGVKYGLEKLAAYAKEEGCSVALFGHTHGMHLSDADGVTLFNPGSAANGNYGVITIQGDGIQFAHMELQ